jgi:hypothetical protein
MSEADPDFRPFSLTHEGWAVILQSIEYGRCTPFLGAGACFPVLPTGTDLAKAWAAEHKFPLGESSDLTRVAEFLAVTHGPMFPKRKITGLLNKTAIPDSIFDSEEEPHGLLAQLPLPVYVTTNYDDLMTRALRLRGKRPHRELCRWNNKTQALSETSVFADPRFEPTKDDPVVYHLHGHAELPDSLVLTEDDYIDFLIRFGEDQNLLPPRIKEAFSTSSVLFLGYRLADMNFRVLFRALSRFLEEGSAEVHLSVQLAPLSQELKAEDRSRALAYLTKYFDRLNIRVYWGTCQQFAKELRQKLKDAAAPTGSAPAGPSGAR